MFFKLLGNHYKNRNGLYGFCSKRWKNVMRGRISIKKRGYKKKWSKEKVLNRIVDMNPNISPL